MLRAGAVTQLPKGAKPTVVSPLGVVPKPRSSKFRLIIVMRYVNRHLIQRVFKFEGLEDLADLAERGDSALSYYLTSGYYHVALHPSPRSFVGSAKKLVFHVYNCLPFGVSTAPWVFSKIMRELVMFWRSSGIRALPYLVDFLFLKQGAQTCLLMSRRVEGDFISAGLQINRDGRPCKHLLMPFWLPEEAGSKPDCWQVWQVLYSRCAWHGAIDAAVHQVPVCIVECSRVSQLLGCIL